MKIHVDSFDAIPNLSHSLPPASIPSHPIWGLWQTIWRVDCGPWRSLKSKLKLFWDPYWPAKYITQQNKDGSLNLNQLEILSPTKKIKKRQVTLWHWSMCILFSAKNMNTASCKMFSVILRHTEANRQAMVKRLGRSKSGLNSGLGGSKSNTLKNTCTWWVQVKHALHQTK